MVDIIHRIGIKSPAAQVYKALTSVEGLAHWWTEEVQGDGNGSEERSNSAFDRRTAHSKAKWLWKCKNSMLKKMFDGAA